MIRLSKKLGRMRTITCVAVVTLAVGLAAIGPAYAGDGPSGYWYGSDNGGPPPQNTLPYQEATCGGSFGMYIGKIGGADLVGSSSNPTGYGPGNTFAWNTNIASDANYDYFTYGLGHGAGGQWFMFGPNRTDGTGLSPYSWGAQQGNWAVSDWQAWYNSGNMMPFQVLWADVEMGTQNGWDLSGTATGQQNNRLVFNGFFDALHNAMKGQMPGMYSSPEQWDYYTGGSNGIPNTWEWTSEQDSGVVQPCPYGWNQNSYYGAFFGGSTNQSSNALVWQWASGSNDYDQLDNDRY